MELVETFASYSNPKLSRTSHTSLQMNPPDFSDRSQLQMEFKEATDQELKEMEIM
jgi:hypothetical protein